MDSAFFVGWTVGVNGRFDEAVIFLDGIVGVRRLVLEQLYQFFDDEQNVMVKEGNETVAEAVGDVLGLV